MNYEQPDSRLFPGSTGSLPNTIFVGKLPTNAGKLPALPNPET